MRPWPPQQNLQEKAFLEQAALPHYHVPGGKLREFDSKKLTFMCRCGGYHDVNDSYAIAELRNPRIYFFSCPSNDYYLNLVEALGFFRIKELKTLATFDASNHEAVALNFFAFRELRELGISSLKQYYATQENR